MNIKFIIACTGLLLVMTLCNAQSVSVLVDADSGRTPISPYIYGRNNSLSDQPSNPITSVQWQFYHDAGLHFTREGGGNNSTKYNWRAKLSSSPDWYNNVYSHDWDFSAQSLEKNLPEVQGFYSFQLIGKAALSASHNFNDWAYNQSQYWSGVEQNLAGGGIVNPKGGPNALVNGDTSLYLKDWPADSSVNILDYWFGNSGIGLNLTNFLYWDMDNEPEIWSSTHDDVISTSFTEEEYMQKYFSVAKAVRAKYPTIKLVGPSTSAEWQWYAWNNKTVQYNGKSYTNLEYFIMRISEEQAATGIRLLDVLDIHFYPTANNTTDMLDLYRVLFDRNYVYPQANGVHLLGANGWDTTINKEYIFGRVNNWLVQYLGTNHGVGLSLSEGQMGDDKNHNVSMCLYANMLGCLSDNGVEIFAPWYWYVGMWETLHLYSHYAKSTRITSNVSPNNYVTAYSSINKTEDSVTVILVNRDTANAISTMVNLSNFELANGAYARFSLSNLPANETFISQAKNALQKDTVSVKNNNFYVNLPALSVTAVILNGTNITTLRVGKSENDTEFNLFPIPVRNNISTIDYSINFEGRVQFEVLDISGKQIKEILSQQQIPGKYSIKFDTQSLKNGTYFLRMTYCGLSKTKPFSVIQ